jgi:hypothetical protein
MLHPQSPLHPTLKVPGRRALLQVPQTGPLWKETLISRAFSTYPSGSPAMETSLQIPFTDLPQRERERHSTSRAPFNHISKSLVDEPTPGCPTEPPCREMPIPRAFLSYPSEPLAKKPPLPGSPKRSPIQRDVPFLSRVPGERTPHDN